MKYVTIGIVILCVFVHVINCGQTLTLAKKPKTVGNFDPYHNTFQINIYAPKYTPLPTGNVKSNFCVISLSTNEEMKLYQPLYITPENKWKLPDEHFRMFFKKGEELVIDCGNGNEVRGFGVSYVRVKCKGDQHFTIVGGADNNKDYDITPFRCEKRVELEEWSETPSTCDIGEPKAETIRVGFHTSSNYLMFYEACVLNGKTVYVKHFLRNVDSIQQIEKEDKKETADYNFFVSAAIGSVESLYANLPANTYDKGHLSPRGDYMLFTHQRVTYSLINVAPQYSKFNRGSWKSLEIKLRKNIQQVYTAYTGTYYDSKSKYSKNSEVPLWFYKVVCNSSGSQCVAYLGMNDEFNSDRKELCIGKGVTCNSGIHEIFCCDMASFSSATGHLTHLKAATLLDPFPKK